MLNIKIFNDYVANFILIVIGTDSLEVIGILKFSPKLAWIGERQQQKC